MKGLSKVAVNDRDLRRQLVEIALNNDDIRRELFNAIENNDIKMCRFVLNGGMNVNFTYNLYGNWSTPLEIALRAGTNIEILRLLFQAGGDPNFLHHDEITPLTLAIGSEDPQIVKLFIDYGGDPNILNKDGVTAYTFLEEIRENIDEELYNELFNILSVDYISV
jgi:ankyrin repeat protein